MANTGKPVTDHQRTIIGDLVKKMGQAAVLRDIRERTGRTISKTVIERAIEGKGVATGSRGTLEAYLSSGVSCPFWVSEVMDGKLTRPEILARDFTMRLRVAMGHCDLRNQRVAFVNHTGQWLKPVLRKLINRFKGRIEVYVADPISTNARRKQTDYVHVLGVLEFFWSLPTSLELYKVSKDSETELFLFTYDGSRTQDRVAYFEHDLVATSPINELKDRRCARGHPGFDGEFGPVQGPETVLVFPSSNAQFADKIKEWKTQLDGGEQRLPGLEQKVTWNARDGFKGFQISRTRGFCIDPAQVLKQIAKQRVELAREKQNLAGTQPASVKRVRLGSSSGVKGRASHKN